MGVKIATKLKYLDRLPLYDVQKPYQCTIPIWHVPGASQSNISTSEHDVVVHDFSDQKDAFSVDIQGFEVQPFLTSLSNQDLANDEIIKTKYYEECEVLLKQSFGAAEVYIFDYVTRKVGADAGFAEVSEHQKVLGPSRNVHVDQTPESARRRVQFHLPERATRLLEGRVRVLNIWRPLFTPLEDNPLALCDYRTVHTSNLVPTDLPSPHYEGELYHLHYSANHRWYFLDKMKREEALVIKCYDSEGGLHGSPVAKFAPHTSFTWDSSSGTTRPRESIEIRALVFS